jgi:3-oxoacyl-[acyl-carrier-protein] synthase II
MNVVAARWGILDPDAEGLPERAHELLGRKGLLGKDRATRLALCAVHRALGLRAAPLRDGSVDADTAVVVACNYGNLETVRAVGAALARGGIREVSPLDAPNASSNVVASTVAIWFRFGGPNLMVCSGAGAGLDAAFLGRVLLRSRRARRVVVVGVEADDAAAVELCRREGLALRSTAACVILELGAAGPRISTGAVPSPPGGGHGAEGVRALAEAVARVAAGDCPAVTVTCGSAADGWRAALVERSP